MPRAQIPVRPPQGPAQVIDSILAQLPPDLPETMADVLQSAENTAIANVKQRAPLIYRSQRGYVASYEAFDRAGRILLPEGFKRERQDQARFLHPSGIRFTFAHAATRDESSFYLTSEKGAFSRDPIDDNRIAQGYALSLFSPDAAEERDRIIRTLWWVVVADGEKSISVYLVFPNELSESGNVLYCEECKHIADRRLSEGGVADSDVTPKAPPTEKAEDFDIRTREIQE